MELERDSVSVAAVLGDGDRFDGCHWFWLNKFVSVLSREGAVWLRACLTPHLRQLKRESSAAFDVFVLDG